jgi:hypothetical protein
MHDKQCRVCRIKTGNRPQTGSWESTVISELAAARTGWVKWGGEGVEAGWMDSSSLRDRESEWKSRWGERIHVNGRLWGKGYLKPVSKGNSQNTGEEYI